MRRLAIYLNAKHCPTPLAKALWAMALGVFATWITFVEVTGLNFANRLTSPQSVNRLVAAQSLWFGVVAIASALMIDRYVKSAEFSYFRTMHLSALARALLLLAQLLPLVRTDNGS